MNRSRRTVLAVIAATGMTLAACGDDDATSEDQAVSTGPTSDGVATDATIAPADPTTTGRRSDGVATDATVAPAVPTTTGSDAAGGDPVAPGSTAEPSVELAAWQTIPITDVDGVTFTLGDYVGGPVLVETFATWCSTCLAQFDDTQEAASMLGAEGAVVALSVETDLSAADVAAYAADNEFGAIRFAVMTPELLAAFADDFGTSVANPPSTPKIVIAADGRPGELTTGPQSAQDLVAELRAAA